MTDDAPPYRCDGCRHIQNIFECLILGVFWMNSETIRSRHGINEIRCFHNDMRLRPQYFTLVRMRKQY